MTKAKLYFTQKFVLNCGLIREIKIWKLPVIPNPQNNVGFYN